MQRKVNDGKFLLLQQTSDRTTHYTDRSQPRANEVREYRVRARNTEGWGPYTDAVMYPTGMPIAPPAPSGTIAAQTVTEGQSLAAMDVSGYFTADASLTLTYSASSSDDAIADATVDGSMVTIMGKAVGMATITVTATDMYGDSATQDIEVTVETSNVAPMPSGTIPPITVVAGEMSAAMDMSEYFTDADDTLTYTTASSDATVADATVDGSMVTVNGIAAGTATIMVTATDTGMLTAQQDIAVTVEAANAAPTFTQIANASTKTGVALAAMDLSMYFSDADDDTLTYAASSQRRHGCQGRSGRHGHVDRNRRRHGWHGHHHGDRH